MEMIKGYNGKIERGTWIYASLYNYGLGVVVGADSGCNRGDTRSVGGVMASGGGDVDIVFEDGHRTSYPESLLRSGLQFAVTDNGTPATDAYINTLISNAAFERQQAEEKAAAEQAAFDAALEAVKIDPDYAHLKPGMINIGG